MATTLEEVSGVDTEVDISTEVFYFEPES